MKTESWNLYWRCCVGAACAALWSWLAFAVNVLVATLPLRFQWGLWFSAVYLLLAFLSIFYCAGIVATLFWHPVADARTCTDWVAWTTLLILAPLLIIDLLSVLLIIFLLPFAIVPFIRGAQWGEECWRRRRWRHLLNLSNDWERDTHDE